MLALRLTRRARFAVQLRRLLVAAFSAGTGFLLLCALGHATGHPGAPGASALRLAWCAAPLAATVYFAVAVARTDPGTRPRPGLSAIGLGPGRLMAVSATTTALAGALGSLVALLAFLHLRGDLTARPFDGAAADSLAVGLPLPFPAAVTLLTLLPATASAAVALSLRPREARSARAIGTRGYGRFGAYGWGAARETFGTYGRFGARWAPRPTTTDTTAAAATTSAGVRTAELAGALATDPGGGHATDPAQPAGSRVAGAARVGAGGSPSGGGTRYAPASASQPPAQADAQPRTPDTPRRQSSTTTLPWGIALLTAGLAVEAYTRNTATSHPTPSAGILLGWTLTALGLALAGPGLTHLCGRLLQAARPGALRLLAGRVLMEESSRIGRPLGVVCAVTSALYAAVTLYGRDGPASHPLGTLGALVVTGATVATLLTAAVEAKHTRADTTAALLRLGAPRSTLRAAAAVRTTALLAVFGPLTLLVAALAALPLAR
ncbi:hypothetical protein [Streptomyces sp. CL12-4]|uniref:hypothetical protein n=1 Tax=Streptomyces sp. CL12-4 TaxID=2810306 RepID=UPI001EFC0B54|nr:hypothetical protein [Streptomyces sp. CL12-4]MCG8964693.1 hypothetical protein [Streptomyces sp. CL12-4]